ncbi:MAG TPA: SDR family oxidoreductase, partial [Elusimicrobiota bacterium]|nr:SDR family oxidoreductase [Elusimicrobiota bacterium]
AAGLAAEGAAVVVNGRTPKRVDEAVAKIRTAHSKAKVSGVAADVGTAAGIADLVKGAVAVDILVNNAGIFEPKAFLNISDEDWLRFFEMNVLSGVRLTRALLPAMLKKNWGRVIFISSESGVQIPPEMIHYGMTKTAQLAVARGVAESVAGSGVTVNAVLPGPTNSEGVGGFVNGLAESQHKTRDQVEKEFFQTMRPTSLIKRFATTEEVAAMVVYLCSEAASATTGAALRVDGGVVRAIA